mmetsp:Transcript_36525/g.88214  ORF Transcript_36525/g.88214 Transcript_36525/m.88214 type:complete len:80 (+) Transcript_36525:39-278(+)
MYCIFHFSFSVVSNYLIQIDREQQTKARRFPSCVPLTVTSTPLHAASQPSGSESNPPPAHIARIQPKLTFKAFLYCWIF